jgi:hypothetical protein
VLNTIAARIAANVNVPHNASAREFGGANLVAIAPFTETLQQRIAATQRLKVFLIITKCNNKYF